MQLPPFSTAQFPERENSYSSFLLHLLTLQGAPDGAVIPGRVRLVRLYPGGTPVLARLGPARLADIVGYRT